MESTNKINTRPVDPKPSSTILLVRDNPSGNNVEVLLIQRQHSMSFGGAYAFPGGKIATEDYSPNFFSLSNGPNDQVASLLLGLPKDGLSYFIGCIRECFEETGVFLASKTIDSPFKFIKYLDIPKFRTYQWQLNIEDITLETICLRENIVLATNQLTYVSHWITPKTEKIRYTTRFFLAPMPPDQEEKHNNSETLRGLWIRPEEALYEHEHGKFNMFMPTIVNLQKICGFKSTEQLMNTKSRQQAEGIKSIEPKVLFKNGKRTVFLPNQPGYDDL